MQNSACKIDAADAGRQAFLDDVLKGLGASKKSLDPKYFYDEAGSRLFEQITTLPEYYITRTETRLMECIQAEIAEACGRVRSIVEFGSGSGRRSDVLLGALPGITSYVPIDVSADLLASTARSVNESHPRIDVQPLTGDFTAEIQIPVATPTPRLGYFPGSTIGNFAPEDAVKFLAGAKTLLGRGAKMLLGVDLVKSVAILEDAYNDAAGVTAQFNKNLLSRINDGLDADFVTDNFAHRAHFERDRKRIEMHLVSLVDQEVTIDGRHVISFRAGESIHTENSHKFTLEGFTLIAQEAGWLPTAYWTDEEQLFSVHLLAGK